MPVSPSELPAAEPRLGRDHVVRAPLRWRSMSAKDSKGVVFSLRSRAES